jgi:uncharacterized delta-60 repeat protein
VAIPPVTQYEAVASAVQSDGRIVVAAQSASSSQLAVMRYNSDGSVDTSFGTGGRAGSTLAIAIQPTAMALAANGKIIVAGIAPDPGGNNPAGWQFGVARFNADGSPDTTFGSGGEALAAPGSAAHAYAVAVQSNGEIVVAGTAMNGSDPNNSEDFAVARFDTNGSLDIGFGSLGTLLINFNGHNDEAHALAIRPDGSIVLAGSADQSGPGTSRFALAQLTSTGQLDPTFGSNGLSEAALPNGNDEIDKIALRSDGDIVTAGVGAGIEVARFTSTGQLDPTFASGTSNITVPTLDAQSSGVAGLALQSDDRILVTVGEDDAFSAERNASISSFLTVRVNADGGQDMSFGGAGQAVTAFDADARAGGGVALQGSQIIVVGTMWTPDRTANDVALARYGVNGLADATFGSAGRVEPVFSGLVGSFHDSKVLADGTVVAVGTTLDAQANPALYIARFLSDGQIDTTFGTAGMVVSHVGGMTVGDCLAIQSDGKIIVAGDGVARFNEDGTPDTTFGSGGGATLPAVPSGWQNPLDTRALQTPGLLVLSDGSILVVSDYYQQFFHFSATGTLIASPTLASLGGVGFDAITGLALQGTSILVSGIGGVVPTNNSSGAAYFLNIARYNASLALDTTFGSAGVAAFDAGSSGASAGGLLVETDGTIYAVGTRNGATAQETAALFQIASDGKSDSETDLSVAPSEATDIVLQPDGKLVVLGLQGTTDNTSSNAVVGSVLLARLNTDRSADSSFGGSGSTVTQLDAEGNGAAISLSIGPDSNVIVAGDTEDRPFLARYSTDAPAATGTWPYPTPSRPATGGSGGGGGGGSGDGGGGSGGTTGGGGTTGSGNVTRAQAQAIIVTDRAAIKTAQQQRTALLKQQQLTLRTDQAQYRTATKNLNTIRKAIRKGTEPAGYDATDAALVAQLLQTTKADRVAIVGTHHNDPTGIHAAQKQLQSDMKTYKKALKGK